MKIVIVCTSMEYLSGSSLYNYTLAIELAKSHKVTVLSRWQYNSLQMDLEDAGVSCVTETNEHYDIAFVSQNNISLPRADKVINIIHSEYDCETPRENMAHYVAIRPSIKEHLIHKHNIPAEKITVIYNGIDLERFRPIQKSNRDYFKVVIPATRDSLRQKMFDYYCSKASKDYRVFIYGKNFGAQIQGDYVYQYDEVANIEDFIGDADLVAGILLGRVNLEARAMDVKSVIHNPENAEDCYKYYPDRTEFNDRHDITKVAQQLLCL